MNSASCTVARADIQAVAEFGLLPLERHLDFIDRARHPGAGTFDLIARGVRSAWFFSDLRGHRDFRSAKTPASDEADGQGDECVCEEVRADGIRRKKREVGKVDTTGAVLRGYPPGRSRDRRHARGRGPKWIDRLDLGYHDFLLQTPRDILPFPPARREVRIGVFDAVSSIVTMED
jgi:hypothetical protein